MPVIEATLAFAVGTAVCGERKAGKKEAIAPMAFTHSVACVQNNRIVLQALCMSDFITTDFSSVNGVQDVRVYQNRNRFMVEVLLSSFRKDVRRSVYAKEREFAREFPGFDFEFYLVDVSRESLENAVA